MTNGANDPAGRRAARLVLVAITSIALVAGWAVHRHAWIAAAGSTAMLCLGVCWPWLGVRGLRASIDPGVRRPRAGGTVTLVVALRNRLPLPLADVRIDVGLGEPVVVAMLGPWRRRTVTLDVRAARRGAVDLSLARARCSFPFDVRLAERGLGWRGELIVWPARGAGPFPPPRASPAAAPRADRAARAIGGDELAAIRPYRAGDPMRHVHWKATARHDRLISREPQDAPQPPARILLDLSAADDASCERAIARAAGAAEHYVGLGYTVELIVGDRAVVDVAAGQGGLERLLDALARLDLDAPSTRGTPGAQACANATLVLAATTLTTKGAA